MNHQAHQESLLVGDDFQGVRIDAFLAQQYESYSRSYFQHSITDGYIKVNQQETKPSYKLKTGDVIDIDFIEPTADVDLSPENISLDILFENNDVIVLNKQPGLVVHPAAGNTSGTLVNALISHFPAITKAVKKGEEQTAVLRPGIVHRLDKDTSGVMVVAKNTRAMHSLSRQIQNRTVKKIYQAICYGWPKSPMGTIISHLGRHPTNRQKVANIGPEKGREAISNYRAIKYFIDASANRISLLEFDIKTGRTHQIRVHASDMGNPIIGDMVYGSKNSIKISTSHGVSRQLLHAKSLTFYLPGETVARTFEAPLPEDYCNFLDKLRTIDEID